MILGSGRMLREDSGIVNVADIIEELSGGKGMEVVADAAAHTHGADLCYKVIKFTSDAVITAITADAGAPITGTLDGLAFAANFELYGKFTSVQLASGSAILYLGAL